MSSLHPRLSRSKQKGPIREEITSIGHAWQANSKCAPSAFLALDHDISAVQARDLAGHVQPDSKTADVMRLCILGAIETGQPLRRGGIRNPYSLVGYGNARYALLAHQANHDIA